MLAFCSRLVNNISCYCKFIHVVLEIFRGKDNNKANLGAQIFVVARNEYTKRNNLLVERSLSFEMRIAQFFMYLLFYPFVDHNNIIIAKFFQLNSNEVIKNSFQLANGVIYAFEAGGFCIVIFLHYS